MGSNTPEPQTRRDPARQELADFAAAPARNAPARRQQLGLIGLLLTCGSAAVFFALRSGPQSANASSAPAAAAPTPLNEFLATDPAAQRRIEQNFASASTIVDDFRIPEETTPAPIAALKANPFRMTGGNGPGSDVRNDTSADRQQQAVLAAVRSLRVNAILHGDFHRACMINDALYQEGQEVNGFIIEEIAADRVMVRKGVHRFELKK